MSNQPRVYELKEVHFEITDLCPHACKHCSTGLIDPAKTRMLDYSQAISIIDNIAVIPGNPKVIHLTGGEPLSHPRVADIISHIASKNIIPSMFTTGYNARVDGDKKIVSFLNKDDWDALIDSELEEIVFSVHSANPTIQQDILQIDDSECLNKQFEAMAYLAHRDISVKINCVPMHPTFDYIEDVILRAKKNGVCEVRFLRFVNQGNARNNPELAMDRDLQIMVSQIIRELHIKHQSRDFSVVTEGHPQVMKCRPFQFMADGCQAGISLAHINLDGDVLGCPAFKQKPEYFAGNVGDTPLSQIWHDSIVFWNLRVMQQANLDQPCKSCKAWYMCYGGCTAQRSWNNETIYSSPDPVCPMGTEKI